MNEPIKNTRADEIAAGIKENLEEINNESRKKMGFSDYSSIKRDLNGNDGSNFANDNNDRKAEKQKDVKKEKVHESLYLTHEQSNMAEEIKMKWRREGKKVTKSQVYIEAIQLLYDKTFLFGKTR